jgi:hypothetical protein
MKLMLYKEVRTFQDKPNYIKYIMMLHEIKYTFFSGFSFLSK